MSLEIFLVHALPPPYVQILIPFLYKAIILPSLRPRQQHSRVTWSPPPSNSFKINYDGVVFIEVKKSRIGVIIRNDQGLVIVTIAQQLPQAYQATKIEVMATVLALKFGLEVGVDQAIVEGDSEIVVQALGNRSSGLASHNLLIKDVGLFTSSFFEIALLSY